MMTKENKEAFKNELSLISLEKKAKERRQAKIRAILAQIYMGYKPQSKAGLVAGAIRKGGK